MEKLKSILKKKEYRISFALLLVPLILTILLMLPNYEEFIAPGDIVSVQELGIDGSVYFTYVESGITENYIEKFFTILAYNNLEFSPINKEEIKNNQDNYEEGNLYKNNTIYNAVVNASTESVSSVETSEQISNQVMEIINNSAQYRGDSFGLMVAIGLVEEMNQQDFSKNQKYVIAGTGTMELDQTIGSVGAIKQKLLSAEENNVDIFFVPKDKFYYADVSLSNQAVAKRVVNEKNLTFDLVPVSTLEEALSFIRNLP